MMEDLEDVSLIVHGFKQTIPVQEELIQHLLNVPVNQVILSSQTIHVREPFVKMEW
jgi:hypothetical protein